MRQIAAGCFSLRQFAVKADLQVMPEPHIVAPDYPGPLYMQLLTN